MINNTIKFLSNIKDEGKRLDILLSEKIPDFSRTYLKKIIENQNVRVDNKIISSPSKKIKGDQQIQISIRLEEKVTVKPKKIKLDIVYEDNNILVINKPSGMVVHPGAGNYKDTLVNALIYKYRNNLSNINGPIRPGIVHRIDKDTSGLLVVAKNNFAHNFLSQQFGDHSIKRTYLALIWGVIRPLKGKIKTFIQRSKKNRKLMSVSEKKGKLAITNYKTIKVFNIKNTPKVSLVEFSLETGRTHQIRVHMQFIKNYIIGDKYYGKKLKGFKKIEKKFENLIKELNGQALHAKNLTLKNPSNKKLISFESSIPKDFTKLLNFLEKQAVEN